MNLEQELVKCKKGGFLFDQNRWLISLKEF